MRNFEERKAEVFRRSEKRSKARKQNRNRILAFCIPLCIIVTVWSVMILPVLMPASNRENAEERIEIADVDGAAGSTACSFVQVEIQDGGAFPEHYELVTDKLEVDQMYFLILNAFENTTAEEVPESGGDYAMEDSSTSKTSAYIFTFITVEGSEATYSLNGNALVVNETGETVLLSADQLAELQKVFRLSD